MGLRNEKGMAPILQLVIVSALVVAASFVAYRVNVVKKNESASKIIQSTPQDEASAILKAAKVYCENEKKYTCEPVMNERRGQLATTIIYPTSKENGLTILLSKKSGSWKAVFSSQESSFCNTGSDSIELKEYCESTAADVAQIVTAIKDRASSGTDTTNLVIGVSRFSVDKKFAYYTANQSDGGGWAGIVWNNNGKWTVIHEGQEGPSCRVVNQYKVPKEIADGCFDEAQTKFVPNNN